MTEPLAELRRLAGLVLDEVERAAKAEAAAKARAGGDPAAGAASEGDPTAHVPADGQPVTYRGDGR